MNRRFPAIALAFALAWAGNRAQACTAPHPSSLDGVASRIQLRIAELESRLPEGERKARPSILLRVADTFGGTSVSTNLASDFRNALAAGLCIDRPRLARHIVSAVQSRTSSLAFIGELGNAELSAIAARINAIGVGNIDPQTVSRLRAFEVNYVVVVGGHADVAKSGCGFKSTFAADLDIHSMNTTEVIRETGLSSRIFSPVARLRSAMQASLKSPSGSSRFGSVALSTNEPVCLGKTRVDFAGPYGIGHSAAWTFDAGCLLPGESKAFTPGEGETEGDGWPETGSVTIRPEGSVCGSIVIDDTRIRPVFAPSWRAPQSGSNSYTNQPPPQISPPGAPRGTVLVGCGCWGNSVFNMPIPNNRCSSGYASFQACASMCPMGGYAYGSVCN